MSLTELKTLATSLNGGLEIDATLFSSLVNIGRTILENARSWVILKGRQASQTITPSHVYTTALTLPTNFRRFYNSKKSVVLRNGTYNIPLIEIPYDELEDYQNIFGYFAVDYSSISAGVINFYITGTIDKSYTVNIYYLKNNGDITDANTWSFPTEFHPILSYLAVGASKGGIDFDTINARMAPENKDQANAIYRAMISWDTNLQLNSVDNQDYAETNSTY